MQINCVTLGSGRACAAAVACMSAFVCVAVSVCLTCLDTALLSIKKMLELINRLSCRRLLCFVFSFAFF